MIRVLVENPDGLGLKSFAYHTGKYTINGEFISFIDIRNNKVLIPLRRLIEIRVE